MRVVFSEAAPPAPWLRFLLRNFVVYNPLFVFSALLALAGALLINPPGADGGRDLAPTVQLFAVIQLYELALLGAAALLRRRAGNAGAFAGETRDVRFLLLVFAPFLLDVTFTTSSLGVTLLNARGAAPALVFAGALVLATLGKVAWAARIARIGFRPAERAALVLGPSVSLVTPVLGGVLAQAGHVDLVGPVLGALVAAVVAMCGWTARGTGTSWILRRLAPLVLVASAVHASATAYAYDVFPPAALGPGLIALGWALPRLAPLGPWADPARVVLPWVGAIACGLDPAANWQLGPSGVLGLCGLLAVHGLELARGGGFAYATSAFVAGYLLCTGHTLAALDGVGSRPEEPLLLGLWVALALWRGLDARYVALPLLAAAYRAGEVGPFGNDLDLALGWSVLGAGVLAWTLRDHGTGRAGAFPRAVGTLLLVIPAGVAELNDVAGAHTWGATLVAGLLLLALYTRLPSFAFPLLLVPCELVSGAAPSSAWGWGVLGLCAAFCGLGLGVFVSLQRERVLGWLDAAPT